MPGQTGITIIILLILYILYYLQCSVACDDGIQIRTVACHRVADNVPVNERFCVHNISTPKPKTQRPCKGSFCVPKWGYDDWGKVYSLLMHHMIQHHHLYCSVKHQLVMRKDYGSETFIATMEAQ